MLRDRLAPRNAFEGHGPATPWDKLHELYFTGYAIWNYLVTPFLFIESGFEIREIEPHQENGETWRRQVVKYPPHIPTHCAEQVLYFSEEGLLRRLDYAPEVVGRGTVSHYRFDHETFGGIVVPTLRRVVLLTPQGPHISGPTIVLLQIADVVVT